MTQLDAVLQEQLVTSPEADFKDDVETSEDSESDSDDSDEASESEAIAKLNEQLLEEIRRAREAETLTKPLAPALGPKSAKEDGALATIQTVLSFAESDQLVRTTFLETTVPGIPGSNVLELLRRISEEGRISPQVAGPLSHVLVNLAKSKVLFSPLPSFHQETLKRKRDEEEAEVFPPSEKRAAS